MNENPMHTPGPWAICNAPQNDAWYAGTTIFSESVGKRVADACILNAEYAENARLIAAAPGMLAALRLVIALYDAEKAPGPLAPGTIAVDLPWVATVREAIANAEPVAVSD